MWRDDIGTFPGADCIYDECYSLLVKLGPKFRSPHPVLTLVLRIFICKGICKIDNITTPLQDVIPVAASSTQ